MPDEIIIRFSVKDDGSPVIERVNEKLGETKKQSTALVPGLESARKSVTGFVSDNAALIGVLVGVGVAFGKALKSYQGYADSVRQLSELSGQNAEASSRFIQVLDDYKISADDALVATRALTNAGYTPSIETLAKLSDQYLSLSSEQEKNEFVLKNLGRGGLQWVEVLQKGSKALLEQGQAVDKNLILNQKMLDDSRKLDVAWDNFKEKAEGASNVLMAKLAPALVTVVNSWSWAIRTIEIYSSRTKDANGNTISFADAARQAALEIKENEDAMLQGSSAAGEFSGSMQGLTGDMGDNEDAAKRLSGIYTDLLGAMFAINDENKNYQNNLDELAKKEAELSAEKDQLTLKMWEEQQAGKLTNDEYLRYIQNLSEITKAQEENSQAIADAGKEHQDASKKRVYDLVQQRLAADGIISSGEFEYMQNLAVQQGLVSRAAADQAIKESQLADTLVNNFTKSNPVMDHTLATMQGMAALNGTVVQFGVNFTQTGSLSNPYGQMNPLHSQDSGGSGIAGTPYMIGTGAQPELFVPKENGTFIPNANKLGSTYNITINNPKKETAENSIRQSLKKLSYIGVAS